MNPYTENIFVLSDLIDVLHKLNVVNNPILDPTFKYVYRNRKQWSEIYDRK